MFREDILNQNVMPVQAGNDLGRPRGNITYDARFNRVQSEKNRDDMKQVLQDCNMHRPTRNEWYSDFSSHTRLSKQ